jgi:hypothetical protein
MNNRITELIEKYNKHADALDESIKIVTEYDLYANKREEWEWYLKGQQRILRDVAIDLQAAQLLEQIAAIHGPDSVISANTSRKRKLPG